MCAARPSSPDHASYLQVKQRLGGKRAALSVAHKLAREAYHTLGELGDQALIPRRPPHRRLNWSASCAPGPWIS